MDASSRFRTLLCAFGCGLLIAACALTAEAAISFGPPLPGGSGGTLVFGKPNEVNPVRAFSDVGAYDSLTVSFGTHFTGQKLGASYNSLSHTSPTGPLALATGLPDVMTLFDLDAPRGTWVLGGVDNGINGPVYYTTPISILFSKPVDQVGFTLGFLDEKPSSTVIEAFNAAGASLGVLTGLPSGRNDLSVVDDGGQISGLTIYVPDNGVPLSGADREGFGIHDVVFSAGGVVPEPGTFLVWSLLGLTAFSAACYSVRPRA